MDATILSQKLLEGADSFPLLAIPFFMLAGELMNAGGISKRIVALRARLGRPHPRRPRLGRGVRLGADGRDLGQRRRRHRGDRHPADPDDARRPATTMPRSAGLIAAGGVIAPVIPPSIGFIMFGVIANVSIGKLFLAGVFPGMLMGLSLVDRLAVGGAARQGRGAAAPGLGARGFAPASTASGPC